MICILTWKILLYEIAENESKDYGYMYIVITTNTSKPVHKVCWLFLQIWKFDMEKKKLKALLFWQDRSKYSFDKHIFSKVSFIPM